MPLVSADTLFYQDIMDSAHCFVFHLYDTGFRIKFPTDASFSSQQFKSICKTAKDKMVQLKKIDGFDYSRFSKNKYSIQTNTLQTYGKLNHEGETFLDNIEKFLTASTRQIMKEEEYDTDAFLEDIYDERHSNTYDLFTPT
eukprot:207238_1